MVGLLSDIIVIDLKTAGGLDGDRARILADLP